MRYVVTNTPEGRVVRAITVGGESAWRMHPDGTLSHCADHKGPWMACSWNQIPVEVRRRLLDSEVANV
jgi:hypothetical protein